MAMIKVSDLKGRTLDYAVALCEGYQSCSTFTLQPFFRPCEKIKYLKDFRYSSDWAQGGPIIDREKITLSSLNTFCSPPTWDAFKIVQVGELLEQSHQHKGNGALTAAMRCYVSSKLGGTVEIPDELIEE